MLKPPAANMPGMTDTLDFVKNLWGSMNLPGANLSSMTTPPLSADDFDKRIADLKAVESWLNMNLAMLRGTIQTMEVQRATLSTLKSMGSSMAEAMRQSGVSAEKMAAMPFSAFFGQPAAAGGDDADRPQPDAAAPDQPPGQDAAPDPAALGMPAALAWWNMLQEQFTQAVASAMKPVDDPANPPPEPPAATPPAQDAPPAANGNGRARGGKAKTDKP